MPLGDHGACRLCWHQALHERSTGEPFDLADANRFGQQLFLANMHYQPRGATRAKHHRRFRASAVARGITRVETEFTPVDSQQLALFWIRPDLTRIATLPAAPDPAMSHYCDAVLHEHAARHGWSTRLINVVGQSLDVLQAFQATSGAKIVASEAASLLTQRGLTVDSTLEVLAAANLLDDDRIPGTRNHFLVKTERLPATMRTQLDTWYTVMAEGSTTPPRRKPRNHKTIRAQLNGMLPILQKWADAGHDSLAEIDKDDVVTALPESGPARQVAHQGLRSLFRILKARKVVFINPTTGVPAGPQGQTLPLPVDTAVICDALNAPHPARALAVALVAFHGLTARQISTIRLNDVGDGLLVDPYLEVAALHNIVISTQIERVMIGGGPKNRNRVGAISTYLGGALDRPIEVRTSEELHDRVAISTAGEVLTIGTSINGLNKHTTMIVPVPSVGAQALVSYYDALWEKGTKLPVSAYDPSANTDGA